ncbi:ABC transporter ATP-binding protein [Mycobacterium sp. NPDC003323]
MQVSFDRVAVSGALVDFDLQIADGETVALLGPSESGMSAALRVLAGLVRPTSGTVRVDGRDLDGIAPADRGIGLVAAAYGLFPHLRVGENVAFGLRRRRWNRRERVARIGEVLQLTGMEGQEKRWPHELSGTDRLRVALARALAAKPSVLLLEEPLAALDTALRHRMLVELQRIHAALPGVTTLYTTTDHVEALALADRIAVMDTSTLLQIGSAERLWRRPGSTAIAALLGAANLIPCTIRRVVGTSALVSVAHRTVCAQIPPTGDGPADWSPGARALLCIRPHALRIVSLGDRDALRANVTSALWRGATTRLDVMLTSLPDRQVTVEVPGRATVGVGAEIGVRIPEPAGVVLPLAG